MRTLAAWLSVAGLLGTIAAAALLKRPDKIEPATGGTWRSGLVYTGLLLALLLIKVAWIGPHTTWFRLASPPGTALPATRPVQAPVGRDVMLLGYDLAPATAVAGATVAPGSELEVTLYWQAVSPLDKNLSSFVHLVAGPEAAVFAESDRQHPGYIPTTTWPTDRYVVDAHRIQLPADTPQVAYKVVAGLYDPATNERWGETTLDLPVHVAARSPSGSAAIAHPTAVHLGEGIELVGYDLAHEENEIALTLYWRAAQRPERDYQVFVHLLDAAGGQIAGADGPPVEGLYPSSQWLPGQVIADRHRIPDPGRRRGGAARRALRPGHDAASRRGGCRPHRSRRNRRRSRQRHPPARTARRRSLTRPSQQCREVYRAGDH